MGKKNKKTATEDPQEIQKTNASEILQEVELEKVPSSNRSFYIFLADFVLLFLLIFSIFGTALYFSEIDQKENPISSRLEEISSPTIQRFSTSTKFNPKLNRETLPTKVPSSYVQNISLQSNSLIGMVPVAIENIGKTRFYEKVSYNSQYDFYLLSGQKDNSSVNFEILPVEQAKSVFDENSKLTEKLITIQSLFASKTKEFSSKVKEQDYYIGHVGIKFKSGTKLKFVNFTSVGDTEVDLKDDVNLEVSKVIYDKGRILFGISNFFVGNGRSGGELFVETDVDEAIYKLKNSFKISTMVTDVQYWWDKIMNVEEGQRFSNTYYQSVSGRVDMLEVLGFKGTNIPSTQYIPGGAIIGGVAVTGVYGGGVCHWATAWNTAFRMGMETYGVDYTTLQRNVHSDPKVRYSPVTVFPYSWNQYDYFDVTVGMMSEPVYSEANSIIDIEPHKSLKVKSQTLYSDPNIGRFLAVIEVTEEN